MRLLTRPAGAALALCLCPSLLTTVQADARADRAPALSTRMDGSRQETIDTFYDRWLRNVQVPVSWSGNVESCTPGTLGAASEAATIDQINFYRELVGSPPSVVDQAYAAMPQRAALMMHANGDLDHYPPPTWRCYAEPFDHNLLSTSPAALGIVSYMNDFGPQNVSVGHRRALLDPWVRSFAVGSTNAYNAILITGHNTEGSTSTGWVAWPPAGLLASPARPFPVVARHTTARAQPVQRVGHCQRASRGVHTDGAAPFLTRDCLRGPTGLRPSGGGRREI